MTGVRERAASHRRLRRVRRLLVGLAVVSLIGASALVVAARTDEEGGNGVGAGPRREEDGGWRQLPPSPLSPRTSPLMVWTGHEVLVIGGYGPPTCPQGARCAGPGPERFRDGAAYDPDTKKWRRIADAPDGRDRYPRGATVLVSDERLWPYPYVSGSGLVVGSSFTYEVEADRWATLAPPEGAPKSQAGATWAGDRMVTFGGITWEGSDVEDAQLIDDGWEWLP